ncbi:c-type cytochrome [Pelagibacterium halotolerans]|uniref:Pyrrolo-quinoline quinone n=1 Tax=Pelagibacterium halotolerans (strain DSM 22347 / JCM 15775 / CGMCC 1.7692 / B2) TaxID=1082931 RepID=G4R5Y9_PELHB|nr:c-type cytochrome [Pelagibacterium halotolerans]AEQ51104.1 pyrrolo-quinoline quinone [Pelagibacterium halotolerans B2]QJR19016.1 cytochrome c [Pelagibacterium halotolerans]SEA70629.1 alcohol dehydrogenase (cytochrome c) [Pelagibacterium halotolerans]
MGLTIHSPAATLMLAAGLVTAGLSLPAYVYAQDEAGPAPVHYTSEQADRGEDRFARDCEDCHGDDLRGGLIGGPPLRGLSFEQKFANGAPASAMFVFMSSLMPPNAPGRYTPEVYADLMAYILQENGFPAGSEPLPSDMAALNNLIVEK